MNFILEPMLARKYRFHGLGSVRAAMRHGLAVRDPFFTIRILKNPKREESRAAVIISRKVAASAVARNRIRRRLFEILRLHWDLFESAFDVVMIAHDARLKDMESSELESRVVGALKKTLQKL